MKDRKQNLTKKSFPFSFGAIPTVLITGSAAILLVFVLKGKEGTAVAYFAYLYSTYALIVGISGLVRLIRRTGPAVRRWISASKLIQKLRNNPAVARYFDDEMFRSEFALYSSVFLNLSYVVIKLLSGFYYRSLWLITLGVYYLCLTLMRLPLAMYLRKNKPGGDLNAELRLYRICGVLMLPVNIVFSGICVMIVIGKRSYTYPGVLIYAMAGYTIYYVISAVLSVVKFRKYGSPVVSATKVIRLTTALISILSLETAMISRFGDNETSFRQITTGVSGAIVCAILLAMGSYMIIKSFSGKSSA